jgi:hypothetical protein
MITAPSRDFADGNARLNSASPAGTTPESQQALVEWLYSFLLSKQAVQGIVWNQWNDAQPHNYAHGGVLDQQQGVKPALKSIADLKSKYLS